MTNSTPQFDAPATADIPQRRLRSPRGGLVSEGRFHPAGSILPPSARPTLEAAARRAAAVARAEPFTVGIRGFSYRIRSVPVHPGVGIAAYQVIPTEKPTELYVVLHNLAGETVCTCPDYVHRRAGTGADCKHGRGLAELGLIPTSRPRVLPPLARR